MREINFRAWDKSTKEWVEVTMDYKPQLTKTDPICSVASVFNGHNNCEIMQSTGLKDKNGKEIYEFMELDNKYEVIYIAPKYVLRDISNDDIIDLYENTNTITKEYTKI